MPAPLPWPLLLSALLSSPGMETPPAPAAPWPAVNAPLTVASVTFPKGFGRKRIYLDAGHGAPGNEGNSSVTCEAEEAHTLRVAQALARRLEATGHFQVKLSRGPGERPPYADRLQEAERWRAALFVSLHSDARGQGVNWEAAPGQWCARNDLAPGYSVLYADDAAAPLVARRMRAARALARRMGEAGFPPYGGEDYVGLYAPDAGQAGAFVSRHAPGRRIFVLRKPSIPSVIIETHHAWDFEEAARWSEARTLEAFAAAVTQGLVDALGGP
ncbi:N-acetylmuramoyl-L-alanine amidase family protein [Melittangium boletus]|uniref:N-acetylmuramoyl-L-alanine amidase family protein n=1 Tax=Melittangium boletus TaxID=83453 RepID=UPI003DA347C8